MIDPTSPDPTQPLPTHSKYRRLMHATATKTQYVKAFAEHFPSSDCDFAAQMLLASSFSCNASANSSSRDDTTTLPLIRQAIHHELHKHQHSPQSIFRSNSLASKLLGQYVRRVGKDYLKDVLAETTMQLLGDSHLSLEIDPSKLTKKEKDPEKALEKNRALLREWTERFLSRIMDPHMVEQMPCEVRMVASYIAQVADALQLDSPILIGGYIMLRFFNPAIVTPDVLGIVPAKKKTPQGQRNLILISKIVQNLANNVQFGNKEMFMVCMNDFIAQKTSVMRNFLMSIVDSAYTEDTATEAEGTVPSDQETNLKDFEERDLIKFHKLFFSRAQLIAAFFVEDGVSTVESIKTFMEHALEVLHLVKELGAPPSLASTPATPSTPATAAATGISPLQEKLDEILAAIHKSIVDTRKEVDNSRMENQYFFYEGKPAIDGKAVFYLIASRLQANMFDHPGYVAYHMFRTLGESLQKPHVLVIDMSFVGIFSNDRETLNRALDGVARCISTTHQSNVLDILVVHAGHNFAIVERLAKHFLRLSNSRRKCIREVSDWEHLMEFISFNNIMLPEESKMFFPQSYKIKKINSMGITQDRQIRLTPKSILFLDPKNNSIRGERLLSEIEEVSAPSGCMDVIMKFHPFDPSRSTDFLPPDDEDDMDDKCEDNNNNNNNNNNSTSNGSEEVVIQRKIGCNSDEERQVLLEDLFETTVRAPSCTTVQAFQVIETWHKGRTKERLYKFSNDCILSIDKRIVRAEFPFVGIEFAKADGNVVLLKMKSRELPFEIQTSKPNEFLSAVEEGRARALELIKLRMLSNPLAISPAEAGVASNAVEAIVFSTVSNDTQSKSMPTSADNPTSVSGNEDNEAEGTGEVKAEGEAETESRAKADENVGGEAEENVGGEAETAPKAETKVQNQIEEKTEAVGDYLDDNPETVESENQDPQREDSCRN